MHRKRERGVAVVEFAIVLAILAPMIVVIVAWGVRFHNAAQADNAAFIAARYYAVKCSTDPDPVGSARSAGAAATSLVAKADITITSNMSPMCTSGAVITAKISKPYPWKPPVPFFGMAGNYSLVGHGAARCE